MPRASASAAGPRLAAHHFLAFTGAPGARLRDHVPEGWAVRLSEPATPEPHCPWLDVRANNHGFFSPWDFPCNRFEGNESPYVVGVFGGSVAHWFALQGGAALCAELDGSEMLAGRRPVVLNFGAGGMKQPQSLLALNYFLSEGQHLDAVVLIDAFNEAALSLLNWQMGYQPTCPGITLLERVTDDLERFKLTVRETRHGGEPEAAVRIARHWASSSRLMHDVCRSQGIAVVQVVQPNQYYSSKPFSEAERTYAISTTTPYRKGVEVVYPLIERCAEELAKAGYAVVNALAAFDEIEDTIYSDNCCHYNLRGILLIKDIVVDNMLLEGSVGAVSDATAQGHLPVVEPGFGDDTGIDARSVKPTGGEDDALYPMW